MSHLLHLQDTNIIDCVTIVTHDVTIVMHHVTIVTQVNTIVTRKHTIVIQKWYGQRHIPGHNCRENVIWFLTFNKHNCHTARDNCHALCHNCHLKCNLHATIRTTIVMHYVTIVTINDHKCHINVAIRTTNVTFKLQMCPQFAPICKLRN
jgi:hypothetical protein